MNYRRKNKQVFLFVIAVFGLQADLLAGENLLEIIAVYHRSSNELASIIRPLLEENEVIIANRSKLIVKASADRIKVIRNLIANLDTQPHRLVISVIQDEDLSVETLNAEGRFRIGIGGGPGNRGRISARGHVYQTAEEHDLGSTQKLQTLEGSPAVIKVGEQFPVHTYSQYGYPYSGTIVHGTEYREVSTGFSVLPRLTGQEVTLEISPWSERLSGSGNGNINIQNARTTLRTLLGKWVEIGGVDEKQTVNRSGTLSRRHSTRTKNIKIFLKVDDLDAGRGR